MIARRLRDKEARGEPITIDNFVIDTIIITIDNFVIDTIVINFFFKDWEFPHFQGNMDIKLPGVDTASFYFRLPRFLKKENWHVHITGKWFNYGIIMLVIILDLNMWKNQIFYSPFVFGQYTNPGGYIYTVTDTKFLETANETILSYAWRSQNINPATNESFATADPRMNSKFLDFALAVKGIAFIPSIVAFLIFGCLIWRYGREEFVVEKVIEDVDKVDGIVIEELEVDAGTDEYSSREKLTASTDSRQNGTADGEGVSEPHLPSDGTPVLLGVQHVTYV